MSDKMSRAEAEAIVHDRARFTLEEHAAERSGGGLPYSDNAVREALAILSQPDTARDEARPEGVAEFVWGRFDAVTGIFWAATPELADYRYRFDGVEGEK